MLDNYSENSRPFLFALVSIILFSNLFLPEIDIIKFQKRQEL